MTLGDEESLINYSLADFLRVILDLEEAINEQTLQDESRRNTLKFGIQAGELKLQLTNLQMPRETWKLVVHFEPLIEMEVHDEESNNQEGTSEFSLKGGVTAKKIEGSQTVRKFKEQYYQINMTGTETEPMNEYQQPLERFASLIEQAIDAETDDFFEVAKILELDPLKDFPEEDLSQINLSNGKLRKANLSNTNLSETNLSRANLKYANLSQANLSEADLSEADLTSSDLTETTLTGANLNNTKVTNARFRNSKGLSEEIEKLLVKKGAQIENYPEIKEVNLKFLISNFCQHPPGSRQWQKAAYSFLASIQKLPNLRRNYYPEYYREDYEEIFNDTLFEITQKICQEFQPDSDSFIKSLTNWINYKLRLSYKTKDLYRQATHKTLSLNRYITGEEDTTFLDYLTDQLTLNGIEKLMEESQQQKQVKIGRQVWDYIQQDPDRKLGNCHPRGYPACTCHLLSLRRHLKDPPDSFETIAKELKVPIGTLTAYWHRRCKPLLREIANQFGYS